MTSSTYLILSIIFLLSPSVISVEWIDCGTPKSFQVELDNHKIIYIYDAEIKVKYDRNELAVYDYPGLNVANILINNTAVTFSGHMISENEDLDPTAFKTSRVFNSKIAGSARLIQGKSNDNMLSDCNIYLSRNSNEEELNIPKKVQIEIIHEAVACLKSSICQNLGVVKPDDYKRAKSNPFNFGALSIFSGGRSFQDESFKSVASTSAAKPKINADDVRSLITAFDKSESNNIDRSGLQSTINKIVDLAIAEVVKKLQEENQGKIKIPDLSQNFSTGSSWWKTTGEFNSFDGTFEDLTTLMRTEDAVLSHNGMKFIASCGFGVSRAFMEYKQYKLRYGIVKVNGQLSANIDGVALAAAISVDYNQKPCRTTLENLRVSQLGKLKIKITGLGPLNKLLSKLVSWITKKWQDEIVRKLEEKLKDVIVKNLNKFNCEKYRP